MHVYNCGLPVSCQLMGLEMSLQLVALFGKVVKPLGGGPLVEKVCYRGQGALRFYSSASLPSLSLLWDYLCTVLSRPCSSPL